MFFEEKYHKPKLKKKRHSLPAGGLCVFPEDIGDLCLFQFALRFSKSDNHRKRNTLLQQLKER